MHACSYVYIIIATPPYMRILLNHSLLQEIERGDRGEDMIF